jgi:hypothetical protein
MDSLKSQTSTATPAEPGVFLKLDNLRIHNKVPPGERAWKALRQRQAKAGLFVYVNIAFK